MNILYQLALMFQQHLMTVFKKGLDLAFMDGTKMFIVGTDDKTVDEYNLSTGFDVSTASYVDGFSVGSQETVPTGLEFSADGKRMFITGNNGDDVTEYKLTTAFDVSTASHVGQFDVSSQETGSI